MKKSVALLLSGVFLGICVALALLGAFPETAAALASSGLAALADTALAVLGVFGLMVVGVIVWTVYSCFFSNDHSGDTGIAVAVLWFGLTVLLAVGCAVAVIVSVPLATVLTVAACAEAVMMVGACVAVSA